MTPALEQVEAAAWEQQYTGLEPELRPLVARLGRLQVFGVGAWPDSAWHHTVVGVGLEEPTPPAVLDAALTLLARLGATNPVLPVVEGAPRELLTGRGFTVGTPLLRLAAPAGGAKPAGPLRVTAVGPEAGATVAAVCLQGFGRVEQAWWRGGLGRPGWTQVVAWDGDTAVATGALFVAGEHAWIGSATTVPAARGRGTHAALLQARLAMAAEQGAAQVSAKCAPGSASYRGLLRAGFTLSHRLMQWRRPAPDGRTA